MAPSASNLEERSPTARDRIEAGIARAAMALLGSVSRSRALKIGARIGELFYRFDSRQQTVALANLARAFPEMGEEERRDIVLRSCRNLGRLLAEVCHFGELTADNVDQFVQPEDPALWTECLERAEKTGAIIMSGHFGNFELLAYSQGLQGRPVTIAHRTLRNSILDRVILDMRERAGTNSVPKKSAARVLLRALRKKTLVGILADQNQTANAGVFADLFGVPACTTPGPARLAMHTGVPIFPVFIVREGDSERHRLVVYPEIEVANTGDQLADMIETTERCNRVMERALTDYPDHWIWFHKRWKTRPPGEPKLY